MINLYSGDDTMKILLSSKKSICRLGDGELKIITNPNYNIGFQKNSNELKSRLESILIDRDNNNNVLISVSFLDDQNQILGDKKVEIWNLINNENPKYIFGAANVTRILKYIKVFKKIWDKIDIIIVEGEYTRSGVGNDLFDNARSIKRIICPAKNAFNKYEEIYNYVINNIEKDTLILCSLGPTATILSYDLSKIGYRILDVGHIDIVYEWRKIGNEKYVIKGKYVNEVNGGNNIDEIGECYDEDYNSQILKIIK